MGNVADNSPPVQEQAVSSAPVREPSTDSAEHELSAPASQRDWSLADTPISPAGRGGSLLPALLRPWLSHKLGTGVDDVRVHTDHHAAQTAARHDANALTYGQNIYFEAGKFNPDSTDGVLRILHETAHTVQQRGSMLPTPQSAARQESEVDNLLLSGRAGALTRSAPVVLREPTMNRRTTGTALLKETARVIALNRNPMSRDDTRRLWSLLPSNYGTITAGSIARRVWTFLFLRHFTEPDPAGSTESVHPRYFYSKTYGWVDAQHFFGFIDFAEIHRSNPKNDQQKAFDAATDQGFDIEKQQQRVRDYIMLQRPQGRDAFRIMQVRPPNTPMFRAPVAAAGGVARALAVWHGKNLGGTQGELFRLLNQQQQDKFLDYSARSAWTYEDPTSNQLGIRFFYQHGERINTLPEAKREAEFNAALGTFFGSIGVVNDQAEIDKQAKADGLPPSERYAAPHITEKGERQKHPELYRLP